jgi:hypothetical protein
VNSFYHTYVHWGVRFKNADSVLCLPFVLGGGPRHRVSSTQPEQGLAASDQPTMQRDSQAAIHIQGWTMGLGM